MRWSHHSRTLFLLVTYLALSCVPWLPLLAGESVPHPDILAATEVLLWVLIWAVFGKPANFHWLLLPAFLILPMDIYLQLFFKQSLSVHQLGILAETNSVEALEFLGGRAWGMLAILAVVASWWVLSFIAARQAQHLTWRGSTRWVFLILAGTLATVTAYGDEFGVQGSESKGAHRLGIQGVPMAPPVLQMMDEISLTSTRPFGLMATLAEFVKQRHELANLYAGAEDFSFQAHQMQPDGAPETVVVVLGESSRYDRWGLNGYERDTTPLLAQERNLVSLRDVVTPVGYTRVSIPLIVTRKPASQAYQAGFNEKSFVSAYKEAGFRTWWLSNQLTYGEHDTPFAAYSQEADEVRHMNMGGHSGLSDHDEDLLAPLQRILAAPAPRKLVVLHTLGNHWNYGNRYPAQFNHWQPSLTGIESPQPGDKKLITETSNSYDNSMRYTDWFLAQVIGQLKQSGQRAVLLFVSDHGEVLRDEVCPMWMHNHGTQHDHHIPAFVWYADQYRARYPQKVAALERNRGMRLATPDIFHTVLDLADIRYPGERLEWSFVRDNYQPRQRLVSINNDTWRDYDTARRTGGCSELTPPENPK